MTKSNKIPVGFVIALIVAIISFNLTWASSMGIVSATGAQMDGGKELILYPLIFVTVISMLNIIENKVAKIISSVVCFIGSILPTAFLFFMMSDINGSVFGPQLEFGFYIMLITSIAYVVLSISAIVQGCKYKKI